jgi:P-type Ca2+ transporter type 2C
MPAAVQPERFLRIWPGRIRIEVAGLLQNPAMADKLRDAFATAKGVLKLDPCCTTGRLLLVFDAEQLSADEIFRNIVAVETEAGGSTEEVEETAADNLPQVTAPVFNEAAVTGEMRPAEESPHNGHPMETAPPGEMADAIRRLPSMIRSRASPPDANIPLPLAVAIGGLLAIGAKQLLFAKSALARSPVPFYLSGLVSVVTGYPFIKRGVAQFGRDKKINTDLLLGTGSLALALVRENLVVLAGLSMLQYVNWKRSRQLADAQPVELSPEIRNYSSKAGKLGVAAAAATWALTRDPLRGIAVLLAANPRPASLPAEVAWKQAEVEFKEQGMPVPKHLSMSRLSRTQTLLLEDTSLVIAPRLGEIECVSHEDEPDKLMCVAASLMEKTDHPWKPDVGRQAKITCRTIRTAFHVTADDDGVTGTVHNTSYSVGSQAYCQRHGISCENYDLEAKRLQKKGFDVLFAAKHTNNEVFCHGLIYRQQETAPETRALLSRLREQGFHISPLRDGAAAGKEAIAGLGLDTAWLSVSEGEAVERIAAMHQEGHDVLLLTGDPPDERSRYLQEAGVASAPFDQLDSVLSAVSGARAMDSAVNEHLQMTKKWNVLGTTLATIGVLTAPLANLASDALSLLFMSRSQKTASAAFSRTSAASHEVASTAEALLWHAQPWDRIANNFGVNERCGLSPEQVKASRARFGPNRLDQRKPVPWVVSYLGQFKEFTTLILVGTSLLAFFTGGMFDGLAMSAVLLANAGISTYQERKAEQVLENLNQFQPPDCTVIRNGESVRVSATDLVPGDVVSLEAGDRIPADLRIIRSWNLEVNEAALTGESHPVAKTDALTAEESPLTERNNMLYMGTDISRGKALGVVVQTGMGTEIGHLMAMLKKDDKEVTPLQQKVTSISKTFIKWAFVAGSVVFVTGLIRGIPLAQMVSTSITLAASAIPEGLPVTITIALSAGIFRMAKKKVLVRKLSALETLGRTTVICSDKTGTLTKNEMTVKQIVSVGRQWTVSGNGYDPEGTIQADNGTDADSETAIAQAELLRIMQIALLCNNSSVQKQAAGWNVQGDPTEGALLFMAAKAGILPGQLSEWHRCEEIPFDSSSGKMSVVCRHADSERECYLFSKGSVESIIRRCEMYQENGQMLPLTDDVRSQILEQNAKLAGAALRVLGFAYRPLDSSKARGPNEDDRMIYVGMTGMIDPPKPGVAESIREARDIGVIPVMITGDHPITAIAIAKQIGIYSDGSRVVSGHELERLTDEELDRIVEEVSIFARVTPEQKLRIVKAYQRRGHTVAMTGDGVNDSPAIKQANVGIAMGKTGTEVTKETADIVLQEDHFGSIVEGVKEGRTIIGNIRKALGCLLTGNLAEIIVTSAAVMIGLPIPLVPIQILLMNLLTDALPAVVLAVNPGNKKDRTQRTDIVDKPLYQKVITRGVLLGLGSLGLFAFTLASGAPVAVAQSVAFATLVAGQLIQTMNWRREGTDESIRELGKDRFMIGAISISGLALLASLYVPPVAAFFHTAPLSLYHWALVLSVAASISLLSKPVLAVLSRKAAAAGAAPAAVSAFAAA